MGDNILRLTNFQVLQFHTLPADYKRFFSVFSFVNTRPQDLTPTRPDRRLQNSSCEHQPFKLPLFYLTVFKTQTFIATKYTCIFSLVPKINYVLWRWLRDFQSMSTHDAGFYWEAWTEIHFLFVCQPIPFFKSNIYTCV